METNLLESVSTKEFTIKVAEPSDVVEALYISRMVLNHLLKNDIVHPDIFFDPYERLKAHADNHSLFILKSKDVSLGFITFSETEPEEFKELTWWHNSRSLYLSRLFVLPYWRNRGIGSALLKFAEEFAKEKGFYCLRLDTSSSIEESNLLLLKHNYRFAGNIYYNFQKAPVNCYEKNV